MLTGEGERGTSHSDYGVGAREDPVNSHPPVKCSD